LEIILIKEIDHDDLDIAFIPETEAAVRAMMIHYAQNARNFPREVLQDAFAWTEFQNDRDKFVQTFPFIVDMSQYKVWDDLGALADLVCCWLSEEIGEGGMWGYGKEGERELWVWADHGHEIGFKTGRDAVVFKTVLG
jgi:hypothetical protein